MTVSVPYSWVKKVSNPIPQAAEIPLFGYPPSFPWEEFSQLLAKCFELSNLNISLINVEWRNGSELLKGLSQNCTPINLTVSPLSGQVTWLFPSGDIEKLILQVLNQAQHNVPVDPIYKEGIYSFVLLEAMNAFTQLNYDKNLLPSMTSSQELPVEDSLTVDIRLSFVEKKFEGRLVISPEFVKSWKERYAQRQLSVGVTSALAQKIDVIVCLEAGYTHLTLPEWKQVNVGDFLTLDSCSLKGESDGRILMTIEGETLFRARIKNGKIKILEHPLHHEVNNHMSSNIPDHEHMLDDEDDHSLFEGDEDVGFEDDENSTVEDHESEEKHEDVSQETGAIPAAEAKKILKPEEITLPIVIEVGRLQINAQKLLELQPGNVLETEIYPENGVDLVVNGQKIGKGELLLIGDVLGVRVLDIG